MNHTAIIKNALTKWEKCIGDINRAIERRDFRKFKLALRMGKRQQAVIQEYLIDKEGVGHLLQFNPKLRQVTLEWRSLNDRIGIWKNEIETKITQIANRKLKNKRVKKSYVLGQKSQGNNVRVKAN